MTRTEAFDKSWRHSPGLAQVNAAAGTFISFVTAAGQQFGRLKKN